MRATYRTLPQYALIFLSAGFVVWAGYGFQVTAVPGWPFPLPAGTHVRIFQSLREHYDLGHPTFAMGKVSTHGWWWYFPLAFALKTPLPLLILALWALLHFTFYVFQKPTDLIHTLIVRNLQPKAITLWLFPCIYTLSSLFSTVNIGYRHWLPIVPFLYISIGQLGNRKWRIENGEWKIAHHVSRFTFYVLLFWLLVGTTRALPYPLTFFNELAGGSTNGYHYLVDSNLDWGQNLWDLHTWMQRNHKDHVYYAHYSPARPRVYGIPAEFLPPDPRSVAFAPWHPAPGLYAIGATVLQGPYAPDLNTYAWFRQREPDIILGHALFVYQVPKTPPSTWSVLCDDAGISAETLSQNLNATPGRVLWLNCTHTQVYPQATSRGLYVTAKAMPFTGSPRLTLRDANGKPTVTLYDVGAPPEPGEKHQTVFDNAPLTFLGYTWHIPNQCWTYWQVKELPTRPLSLMAHLIGPDGTAAAVGDGLGFPIEQWQSGDLIIQRHDLTPSPQASPGTYTVHIGGYWLDTMERWSIQGAQDSLAIHEVYLEP